MPEIIQLNGLTNQQFFEEHARPGRIGMVGGSTLIDRMINRGQRHANADGKWSLWSHAFMFQGKRADGHHWIIESDIAIQRKHIRLGAQENRIAKYFDSDQFNAVAVLDLGLTPAQEERLIIRGLELVATGARYSIRELFGTLLAMRDPVLRSSENRLAREHAFYCSAFVRHLFSHAGIELVPGIAIKNTTPEDVAQTAVAQKKWMLVRPAAATPEGKTLRRVRAKQGIS